MKRGEPSSLTAFKNEVFILRRDRSALVEVDRPGTSTRFFVAVRNDGVVDYPNFNGTVVTYDRPEWFGKAFKDAVQAYSASI